MTIVSLTAMTYVLIGVAVTALAAWLLGRAALRGMRRYVRNLWPH